MRGRHRSLAALSVGLLGAALSGAASPAVVAQDEPIAGLRAAVDFGDGGAPVMLPLEAVDGLGFTFFDPDDPRALVQAINGCALNDRFWVLAANLSPEAATLQLEAEGGTVQRTFELAAREPSAPVDLAVGLAALPICDTFAESGGGVTPLEGVARFSGVGPDCKDETRGVSLIPRTRGNTFREFRFHDGPALPITSESPVTVIDDRGSERRLMLFAESRLPGRIEGVSFLGPARLLPTRAVLAERLSVIRDGRVRRAYEEAINGGRPRPLIEELGLRRVSCVHHVSLEFVDDDARDRLFLAGWLKEDPEVIDTSGDEAPGESDGPGEPASDAADADDDRFIVEIIDSEGRLGEIPLLAGPSDRASSIRTWTFQDQESLLQLVDACALSGSTWGVIGSLTEAGFKATFLDLDAGASSSYQVQRALGDSLSPVIVDGAVFQTCS